MVKIYHKNYIGEEKNSRHIMGIEWCTIALATPPMLKSAIMYTVDELFITNCLTVLSGFH